MYYTIDKELERGLRELAQKHDMTYENLCEQIYDNCERGFRYADIQDFLSNDEDYKQYSEDEDFINRVVDVFFAHEDSEYGLWDNIESAVKGVLKGWY